MSVSFYFHLEAALVGKSPVRAGAMFPARHCEPAKPLRAPFGPLTQQRSRRKSDDFQTNLRGAGKLFLVLIFFPCKEISYGRAPYMLHIFRFSFFRTGAIATFFTFV